MQDQDSGVTPDVSHRSGLCPACGHNNIGQDRPSPSISRGLRALLGIRQRPARCDAVDEPLEPWGDPGCRCRDAFHGS